MSPPLRSTGLSHVTYHEACTVRRYFVSEFLVFSFLLSQFYRNYTRVYANSSTKHIIPPTAHGRTCTTCFIHSVRQAAFKGARDNYIHGTRQMSGIAERVLGAACVMGWWRVCARAGASRVSPCGTRRGYGRARAAGGWLAAHASCSRAGAAHAYTCASPAVSTHRRPGTA